MGVAAGAGAAHAARDQTLVDVRAPEPALVQREPALAVALEGADRVATAAVLADVGEQQTLVHVLGLELETSRKLKLHNHVEGHYLNTIRHYRVAVVLDR